MTQKILEKMDEIRLITDLLLTLLVWVGGLDEETNWSYFVNLDSCFFFFFFFFLFFLKQVPSDWMGRSRVMPFMSQICVLGVTEGSSALFVSWVVSEQSRWPVRRVGGPLEGVRVGWGGSPGLVSLLATPPLMAVPVDTACRQLLLLRPPLEKRQAIRPCT